MVTSGNESESSDPEQEVKKLINVPLDLANDKTKNKITKEELYTAIIELHKKNQETENKLKEVEKKYSQVTINDEFLNKNAFKSSISSSVPLDKENLSERNKNDEDGCSKFFNSATPNYNFERKKTTWNRSESTSPPRSSGFNIPFDYTHMVPKILKLDPNTPKFYGNQNEDVDDWLYKIKINLEIALIPEDKYLDFITNYCLSKAGVFLRRIRESYSAKFKKLTWNELRENFIKRYRPIDHVRRIRNQLMSVKHTNSFNEYVDNFQHLMNQLEPNELSNREKLHYFIEGLQNDAKFQIISRQINSLDEAILIASELESCKSRNVHSVQMAQRTRFHYKNRNSYGNYANRFQNNYRSQSNNLSGRSRFGNSFNNSYNNKFTPKDDKDFNKYKDRNSTRPQFVKKAELPITCFKCKQTGHFASNCRVKTNPAGKQEKILTAIEPDLEMLKISGLLNNFTVDFYFDSGATTSIVSHRIVQKYNIPILPSQTQIRSANNAVDTVIGITPSLTINVENHVCTLQLLIMDLQQYDVLLGLNWFQATKAGLYPAQKVLKFEAEQIHLGCDNTSDDIEEVNIIGVDDEDLVPINFEILSEKNEVIKSSILLDQHEEKQFTELITSIEDVFAYDYTELGCCDIVLHTVNTSTDVPIYIPKYRKSQFENNLIKEEIDKMLTANIIRPSTSPWSSSVVMVPKPDKTKRICIDYRKLNAITIPDGFPLPRVLDILDSLAGSTIFTTLDLKAGYWQTKLDETSIPKTAFTTSDGHYEFLRTPFGLRNAPSQFSRLMQILFGKYKFVSVYLDDITVHSPTFTAHVNHVKQVISVLRMRN